MTKVDQAFQNGFDHLFSDGPNPHIWSSNNWLLFEAGNLFRNGGWSTPIRAKKSRGYTVRVETIANDFLIRFDGDDLIPWIERL